MAKLFEQWPLLDFNDLEQEKEVSPSTARASKQQQFCRDKQHSKGVRKGWMLYMFNTKYWNVQLTQLAGIWHAININPLQLHSFSSEAFQIASYHWVARILRVPPRFAQRRSSSNGECHHDKHPRRKFSKLRKSSSKRISIHSGNRVMIYEYLWWFTLCAWFPGLSFHSNDSSTKKHQ